MLIEHQHPHNRSMMISILGIPNVGKSSLINNILGFNLSAVTSKPQTTRTKFHCVYHNERVELVFVDTPGLHSSGKEFNKRINEQAREAIMAVDLNLVLLDLTKNIEMQLKEILENLKGELGESWIVFTKRDLLTLEQLAQANLPEIFEMVKTKIPKAKEFFAVSAKTGKDMETLIKALEKRAPEGAHLYPENAASNQNERFFVAEYIREVAFKFLNEELPYELAVQIEEFHDYLSDEGPKAVISACLLVNRPSQRAIVVGRGGNLIKEIGIKSRQKIEALLGKSVRLNLHVKVVPNWFSNNRVLESLGLPRASDSRRVWRKHESAVQ